MFVELPPVIEASHILQRSGENFRKYLFSFNTPDGKEFGLNPDLSLSAIAFRKKGCQQKRKFFIQVTLLENLIIIKRQLLTK